MHKKEGRIMEGKERRREGKISVKYDDKVE